jgi:hypothetical protein
MPKSEWLDKLVFKDVGDSRSTFISTESHIVPWGGDDRVSSPTLSTRSAPSIVSLGGYISPFSCRSLDHRLRTFPIGTARSPTAAAAPVTFNTLDREAEITPFGSMDKHSTHKTLYFYLS